MPAIEDAVRRIVAAGKPAGILTFDQAFARTCMAWGTRFTAVGMDLALSCRSCDRVRRRRAWPAGCLRDICNEGRRTMDRFRWHPKARLFGADGTSSARAKGRARSCPTARLSPRLGSAVAAAGTAFRIGAPDQPPPAARSQPVFETLTSGSTGPPRRIRRTQASWTASFAVNAGFGIGPGARVAVPGRLVHSLSLYGAVEGLHLGAEVHLLDGLRPDRSASRWPTGGSPPSTPPLPNFGLLVDAPPAPVPIFA